MKNFQVVIDWLRIIYNEYVPLTEMTNKQLYIDNFAINIDAPITVVPSNDNVALKQENMR